MIRVELGGVEIPPKIVHDQDLRRLPDPNAALTNILYSGEQYNPTSGLQYLRARWYNPESGLFNRLDPFAGNMQDPQSLHKFAYTHNNPVMATDPTGLFSWIGLLWCTAIFALLGGIIGGAYSYSQGGSIVKGALVGAGIGAAVGATIYLAWSVFSNPTALARFFSDPRKFKSISKAYWKANGPANGSSLHHWLLPQRFGGLPDSVINAGFNLLRMPKLTLPFTHGLGLNQFMGFAIRWGGKDYIIATAIESGIKVFIPVVAGVTGYLGYWAGKDLFNEAVSLGDAQVIPLELNNSDEDKLQNEAGRVCDEEFARP